MARTLRAPVAEPEDRLMLRQPWMDGTGDDGIRFEVTCGAGVGSSFVTLAVWRNDVKLAVESFDMTPIIYGWVNLIVGEAES